MKIICIFLMLYATCQYSLLVQTFLKKVGYTRTCIVIGPVRPSICQFACPSVRKPTLARKFLLRFLIECVYIWHNDCQLHRCNLVVKGQGHIYMYLNSLLRLVKLLFYLLTKKLCPAAINTDSFFILRWRVFI